MLGTLVQLNVVFLTMFHGYFGEIILGWFGIVLQAEFHIFYKIIYCMELFIEIYLTIIILDMLDVVNI